MYGYYYMCHLPSPSPLSLCYTERLAHHIPTDPCWSPPPCLTVGAHWQGPHTSSSATGTAQQRTAPPRCTAAGRLQTRVCCHCCCRGGPDRAWGAALPPRRLCTRKSFRSTASPPDSPCPRTTSCCTLRGAPRGPDRQWAEQRRGWGLASCSCAHSHWSST